MPFLLPFLRAHVRSGVRGLQALVDPGMVHGLDPVWLHQVVTGDRTDVAAGVWGAGYDQPRASIAGLELNTCEAL